VDHVDQENGTDAGDAGREPADYLWMRAVGDDGAGAPGPNKRPQRDDESSQPQRLADARPGELDDLHAGFPQARGQVAAAEAQAGDHTSSTKLGAGGEQIQQRRLGSPELGRRLDEDQITLRRAHTRPHSWHDRQLFATQGDS